MRINELEVTCKQQCRQTGNLLTFTVSGDVQAIIDEVKNGGAVVENDNVTFGGYTEFENAVVLRDGSVAVTLRKPETWREVIERLEAENEALRSELLDTQEALAELFEATEVKDVEEGGEEE